MHALLEELLAAGPVITDGAWGTQLQARGLVAGECPDAWNVSHADRVEQVARAYVEAGSRVVLTNTFRSNRLALAGYDLADQVAALNQAGAAISCRAALGRARVFASLGPSGKMLLMGEVSEEELHAAFVEQAQALAAGGAEGLVVETMADLVEAKLAVAAARTTGLPVVVCMTFDSGSEQDRTLMGVTPEQAAAELTAAGADVIGANCGQGIAGYVAICRRLRAATDRPLWIKANAGVPEVVDGQTVWRATPAEFARHGPALIEAGASFLGGCCGTGPAFIAALAKVLEG
ncbi:MAG: homocysteine S-methyltransferase family protein [Planctomycetota bacterium]|nr:homocysteine S-methyltransferase family protein [Planctomycetota bacterium]